MNANGLVKFNYVDGDVKNKLFYKVHTYSILIYIQNLNKNRKFTIFTYMLVLILILFSNIIQKHFSLQNYSFDELIYQYTIYSTRCIKYKIL